MGGLYMKRLSILTTLLVVIPCLYLRAQQAHIEYSTRYATSIVDIAPIAVGYNGIRTPIDMTSPPTPDSKAGLGNGFSSIITSATITVSTFRFLTVDLRAATTILGDDPIASKGVLRTSVDVVDAETGAVLRKELGLFTFMSDTKMGRDTDSTEHVRIDCANLRAAKIILRFTVTRAFGHNVVPHISINTTPNLDIDQVR
jgi:hypothetical protein